MLGLEAIAAHNGWAMASIGTLIVFTGLVLLSLAVSQIHKILQLWDRRGGLIRPRESGRQETGLSPEVKIAARQIRLLIERIGDPFSLPRLLELSQKAGLTRSRGMINELLEAGLIVPDEEGTFSWNQRLFETEGNNS